MGLDFVLAISGGMGTELAHKTLESQFRVSLLTANDAFFIIEDFWVQIVISVNAKYRKDLQCNRVSSLEPFRPRQALARPSPGLIGAVVQMSNERLYGVAIYTLKGSSPSY
ncbi:hypothetical protein AVEN_269239-1 [Araneus ventricosus]|uniref:Uncharacterized protein n=1 Tax=Araneus ventricosus TaxID=182803 RepID=A0A4Y2W5E7_ARAVE|nr:hypothetical protein AVEN_269239-1 [Araneus ventricosus]